ncbi:MAG: hypothetical protein Q4F07_00745 [Bacteroidales bacterium]|nr:hypothetical protein [Bacteroidales bacterium]
MAMKLYIKTIALAIAALGITPTQSCSETDIYNVDATAVPQAADYDNDIVINVDQETNTVNFSFVGKGVYPVWIIDGKTYSTKHEFSRYYRKAGEYSIEVKIANANGMSLGTLTKTFTIEKTKMDGFGGYVYDSPFNLWKTGNARINSFFYAPGWSQIADPTNSFDGDTFTLMFPEATTDQWQAQMHVGTDISLSEGEHYDGSVIFTASMDMNNVTLKIHPDGDDDDAHSFFPNQKINLTAGEPKTFWFSDLEAAVPMNNIVFTFDFGGNPAGVEVTIENIVIKKHSDDDGTELPELPSTPEPNWVGVDSPDNLWSLANYTNTFYYAPGWAQIADPVLTFSGRNFSVDLPEATTDQWQAQVAFATDLTVPDADVPYDFKVTLKSNADHPGVTVKLVQADEGETKHDGNFFFAERVPLTADSPKTFWVSSVKPVEGPMHAVNLVFDFGGNAAGTTVEISDITLQLHHD